MSKSTAPTKYFPVFWMVTLGAIALIAVFAQEHPRSAAGKQASNAATMQQSGHVRAGSSEQPLAFEANQGQTDARVKYMARSSGYTVFLTQQEAVLSLTPKSHSSVAGPRRGQLGEPNEAASSIETSSIAMQLVNGNPTPQISAGNELPGKSNYFIGDDPSKWHADVKHFATVKYEGAYPGVDLAFHGQQRQMEFDYIVAPGADVSPIAMRFSGTKKIATDAAGSLVLTSAGGDVVLQRPVAYQLKDGSRETVSAGFVVKANGDVAFNLGAYDRSRELVIDPTVTFATYLGGSAEDDGYGVGFDSFGNVYVTGQTASTNFPGVSNTSGGGFDAFVAKISPDGSRLLYSTYIGGSGSDSGNAIAVDYLGNAYVAGGTTSNNFPHTGGFQTTFGGSVDAFVLKLNSSGSIVYSSYLGAGGDDVANGIAIDSSGAAYVGGSTTSQNNFPLVNAYQGTMAGTSNGFVSQVSSSGGTLSYSTYLGAGSKDFASGVAVDSTGKIYVTGATENSNFPIKSGVQTSCGTAPNCNGGVFDAFVTILDPSQTTAASQLVYSTFLGGEGADEGLGIAVDSSNRIYVTGLTQSASFPRQAALYNVFGGVTDAFVAEIDPSVSGSAGLIYSTYLGGSLVDVGTGIAVDENGNAYVTGQTASTNFPTKNPIQASLGGGAGTDAFVSEIGASGSTLVFSTYLGGSGNENVLASGGSLSGIGGIAVELAGADIYVAGNTGSSDFPTVSPKQSALAGLPFDAFVASYNVSTAVDFAIAATTPAAVSAGSSGSSTVTLTSQNGYANQVSLTCLVSGNGSPLPTCGTGAFGTNPVTPSSGGATSTLTIKTTGASAALRKSSNIFYAMWMPVIGFALIGMRFSSGEPRRKKLLGFLLLGIVMASLFLLPACSSGSGGGGGGGCSGCTPAGNYTVTVSGTDAAGLVHSTNMTLTVN